jgi:hypothetical protein
MSVNTFYNLTVIIKGPSVNDSFTECLVFVPLFLSAKSQNKSET